MPKMKPADQCLRPDPEIELAAARRSWCWIAPIALATVTATVAGLPSGARADVVVRTYRAPPVYVAPRVVVGGPVCTVRATRVWVGDRYEVRAVRRCY